MNSLLRLSLFACVSLLFGMAAVRAQLLDPYEYVQPTLPFDEPAAKAQLEPGTATIRGTLAVKENKALIKALNISKSHAASTGTVVTLMPHSAYVDAWIALDKKLSRRAQLKKAALSPEAHSYRILSPRSPITRATSNLRT